MRFKEKEIEILARRRVFGKEIAEIRILSTGEIRDVPLSELSAPSGQVHPAELSFKAMAGRIRNEMQAHRMLAPMESNVVPLPHQILALEKVMAGQFLRFLIADEVGMGKTIETGLILKELKLRGIVKRCLVIVPKSAMLQWKQEMKKHFNETFHIYDTEYINTLTRTFTRLDADNEINIWAQHNQLIVSMDSLRPIETRQGWSREKVEEYNKARILNVLDADFDLLIIDECHKVGGGSQTVGRYQMADILCNAIPNVLLLSATPHRGKSDHFRRILGLLDADAFTGEGMPTIPELEPYVVRTEKRQAVDYQGKPLFQRRRTEKTDVTYDAVRHAKQKRLYESVGQYVVSGFNFSQQTKNTSYGFVMILFQRLVSSSTQAILDAMEKRAARLSGERSGINRENLAVNLADLGFEGQLELDFEVQIESLVEEVRANYDTELEILRGLIRDAKDCLNTETDAKADFLLEKLSELKRAENNPALKFLIFTDFTSTQRMLQRILSEKGGYPCCSINGSMGFEERVEALRQFKEQAQILISTDAAGESLNMQFAHIVINYDMPWNPMVVEQRIGRVDRIGQNHEVLALNLLLDNSVDKRVYEVVEIKLNQILNEMGIDKTSDVLDSTIERDGLQRLYLTSLLNPEKFEAESADWLTDIRQKLAHYKSTEGALPTLASSEMKADKIDAIQYSPLPTWLELLSKHYLTAKNIPYTNLLEGMKFKFPGMKEQVYTFNMRESLNNPIPEPISLQHEIMVQMLSEAVPFTGQQRIPLVRLNPAGSTNGFWSLWQLEVKNSFETQVLYFPMFLSSEDKLFAVHAQDLWGKIAGDAQFLEPYGLLEEQESISTFQKLSETAETMIGNRYQEIETAINNNTARIFQNKEKAFEFQEKQLKRVGIENIRQARLQRLFREKEQWLGSFDSDKQILPDLKCLLAIAIQND